MHADELRRAINRVVEVLAKADILAVVKRYRVAQGSQRAVAAARLGHAGAVIMENMDKFSAAEKAVAKRMHLDSLGTTQYWQELLESVGDPASKSAELVHLYSRVMFATSHLPNLAELLDSVDASGIHGTSVAIDESRLHIRLTDAGERASDPDRVARSVDGIDMLYSACASIARKPAMDLRLDGVDGREHRDIYFTGDPDSLSAVTAVIESIPAAIEEIHDEDDVDLEAIVNSLPIFTDLATLAGLGSFSETDLKDISDTMHQGAMLVLESGVILVPQPIAASSDSHSVAAADATASRQVDSEQPSLLHRQEQAGGKPPASANGAATEDEHYARYLREREAMQKEGASQARGTPSAQPAGEAGSDADNSTANVMQNQDAVDELLKNLGRARDN